MPPKSGKEVGDPFAGLDGSSSAAEDAASLHGTQLGAVQSIRVVKVPIYDIQPDPLQPRRIIPNELRDSFHGEAQAFLRDWIEKAEIEPMEYFGEDFEIPVYEKPIQTSLQQVLLLARSIRDTGLTNPVTVIRAGRSQYTLETGERRWFAFQLLNALFGDEFADIPARVMNERSVWRQASENNQRDDLNAIAKARQYALLVMDVLVSKGEKIASPENFSSEREYYAQVKDISVPHGFGDKIQNAMGFASRMSVMRHRHLLGLPDELWALADDYNCPESVLRQFLHEPKEVQLQWFYTWLKERGKFDNEYSGNNAHWGEADTRDSNLNPNHERVGTSDFPMPAEIMFAQFNKLVRGVNSLFKVDGKGLSKKKREEYRQRLNILRQIINELETKLNE